VAFEHGEVEVVFPEAFTSEPRMERQRYELLGEEEVVTPAGRFAARQWALV
jgi:predicted amidohydrolase